MKALKLILNSKWSLCLILNLFFFICNGNLFSKENEHCQNHQDDTAPEISVDEGIIEVVKASNEDDDENPNLSKELEKFEKLFASILNKTDEDEDDDNDDDNILAGWQHYATVANSMRMAPPYQQNPAIMQQMMLDMQMRSQIQMQQAHMQSQRQSFELALTMFKHSSPDISMKHLMMLNFMQRPYPENNNFSNLLALHSMTMGQMDRSISQLNHPRVPSYYHPSPYHHYATPRYHAPPPYRNHYHYSDPMYSTPYPHYQGRWPSSSSGYYPMHRNHFYGPSNINGYNYYPF